MPIDEAELERTQVKSRQRVGPTTRLMVYLPGQEKEEVELTADEVVLGRSKGSDIVLPDASISREHAKLRYEGGTYLLTDMGSTNGLRVNGEQTKKHLLMDEDMIQMGRVFCKFVIAGKLSDRASDSGRVQVVQRSKKQAGEGASISERLQAAFAWAKGRPIVWAGGVFVLLMVVIIGAGGNGGDTTPASSTTSTATDSSSASATDPAVAPDTDSTDVDPDKTPSLAERTEEIRRQKRVETAQMEAKSAYEEVQQSAAEASTVDEIRNVMAQIDPAKDRFERVLRLAPDDANAAAKSKELATLESDLEQRIQELEQSRQQEVRRQYARGQSHYEAGRYSSAIAAWRGVLQKAPDHSQAQAGIRRARSAIAQQRQVQQQQQSADELMKELRETVESANQAAGNNRPATAVHRYTRAKATADKVLALDLPQSSDTVTETKALVRQIDESIRPLQRRVTQIQEKAKEHYGKGVTYASLNRYDEARTQWQKVLEISQDPSEEYHQKAKRKLSEIEGL